MRFSLHDDNNLAGAIRGMLQIDWDEVERKQLTQMFNRSAETNPSQGGTPVDTGEMRKRRSWTGKEFGYVAEYAPHVEYGHRTVGGGYVNGQHFLRNNRDIQEEIYKADVVNAMRGGLR